MVEIKKQEYDFRISGIEKKEMEAEYERLEAIVRRIKNALKQLNAFKLLFEPYTNIFEIVAPPNTIISSIGKFNVRRAINIILAIIGLGMIFVLFMPLISGFMKLPWIEMVPVCLALIGMWFIEHLKRKLKVSL